MSSLLEKFVPRQGICMIGSSTPELSMSRAKGTIFSTCLRQAIVQSRVEVCQTSFAPISTVQSNSENQEIQQRDSCKFTCFGSFQRSILTRGLPRSSLSPQEISTKNSDSDFEVVIGELCWLEFLLRHCLSQALLVRLCIPDLSCSEHNRIVDSISEFTSSKENTLRRQNKDF